jgi:uncharacterized membrane protein
VTFGDKRPQTYAEFAQMLATTPDGWHLIIRGMFVGFLFAVAAFTLSVVSFPLLLDRNVKVLVAIETSLRCVRINPVPMPLWGLIVAISRAVGSLPLLIGLAIIIPILGHATWHLYRALVI